MKQHRLILGYKVTPTKKMKEVKTMYDYNITIQEHSDFLADMAEMNAINYIPSDEEMQEMAEDAMLHGLLV